MGSNTTEYNRVWRQNARKDPDYRKNDNESMKLWRRRKRAQERAKREYIAHLRYEWANGEKP